MVSGEEERACFAASGESKMARMGRVGAFEVLVVSYLFYSFVRIEERVGGGEGDVPLGFGM
jgi:hypothetical protein